ncbi:MAG: hypothetical protein GY867_10965 [bacterium]|nr:hypothetical protein [bacterium]
MKRLKDSSGFGLLLNLLLPGAGHIYRREYAFGSFVFLILLLAAALFFASFLAPIPVPLGAALFALPVVFYLFTFVDLARTMKRNRDVAGRSSLVAASFLLATVVFQLAAPVTPVNFAARNTPEVYRTGDNRLAPMLRSGDFALTNPLAYRANLFFFDLPVWHELPNRGDLVRFVDRDSSVHTGLVLGLSDEEVEVIEGQLRANGFPVLLKTSGNLRLTGDMPLTLVEPSSILVASFNLGAVDRTRQVSLDNLTGRVSRLF